MSERVQTCFLRRSRQNEILEVWKHSICTSHSSLIAVLTAQDSDFMYRAEFHVCRCRGRCSDSYRPLFRTVFQHLSAWNHRSNLKLLMRRLDLFAATSVVTTRESWKRRRDNFQLCWCKQNLITSGCFPAVGLDVFDWTTGHFLMFFLFFWRMFLTRNCHVSRPC